MKEAYTNQIADALRCHVHVTTKIINVKRDLYKRLIQIKKKQMKKRTIYVKRDLYKRLIQIKKKQMKKRTMNVKRDLYKRPIQIKDTNGKTMDALVLASCIGLFSHS